MSYFLRWVTFFVACVMTVDAGGIPPEVTAKDTVLLARNRTQKRVRRSRSHNRGKKEHPNSKYRVVIDAGHGGEDYGTYSLSKPRQHEKHLTLSTAFMLRDHLQKMGYQVLMTRTTDTFVSLQERIDFAAKKNATLFVSVHYNSAPSQKAHGIEVFYYKAEKGSSRTKGSASIAETVLSRSVNATHAKSRGVKHGNFKVIRETSMPAVLVEGGFLTNENELKKVKNPAYQNKIAKAIALGVDEYLHTPRRGR